MFKLDRPVLNYWVEDAQCKVSGKEFHWGIVRWKKGRSVTVGIGL